MSGTTIGQVMAKIPKDHKGTHHYGIKLPSYKVDARIVFHNRKPYLLSDSPERTVAPHTFEYKDHQCSDWWAVNTTEEERDFVDKALGNKQGEINEN